MKTELFYGWIANHFSTLVKQRPLVLLVDGHSTHIDVETSTFCKENEMLLYCLPPHSSHITQPLDIGFFSPLKNNWKIAINTFRQEHIDQPVTKCDFTSIFKQTRIDSIKPRTIVNSFKEAGIYPVDKSKAKSVKTAPSKLYCITPNVSDATKDTSPSIDAITALEAQMDSCTIRKYEERLEEGYNLEDDLLNNTWSKLKKLADKENSKVCTTVDDSNPIPELGSLTISSKSVVDEILVYPKPIPRKGDRGG